MLDLQKVLAPVYPAKSKSLSMVIFSGFHFLASLPVKAPTITHEIPSKTSSGRFRASSGVKKQGSIKEIIKTEIGKIGKALRTVEQEKTLLQRETGRLVRNLTIVGLSLCALVVGIYGFIRSDWLNGLLAGITLAMATLPEELPVVLTIFLALGAWRIAQKQVLARRVPAIETLGSTTVLCVDKTGTLTQNRMSASKLFAKGRFWDILHSKEAMPEVFHELVEFSILASQIDPFDPMERAIKDLGEHHLARTEHLHQNWSLVQEYPLSKELLSLSRVWKSPGEGEAHYVIAAKGAPEAIAGLCHFDANQTEDLTRNISAMAEEGLRVLGVAKAGFEERALPGEQHDFRFEFLGLIGLADPVRPMVPEAVRKCYTAGMRVVMITGDYPGTAQNIARQIGLIPNDMFITGSELDSMDDAELRRRIKTVNIFARVVPEQKLRLVNAFKDNGEIVAMTGDGVNDAPALKSAHIGIAMGDAALTLPENLPIWFYLTTISRPLCRLFKWDVGPLTISRKRLPMCLPFTCPLQVCR